MAFDGLCIQNEAWGDGFLRVIFNPGSGFDGCDNVRLVLEDQVTKTRHVLLDGAWCNRPREFRVIVERHALGPVGYFISLEYEKDNRRVQLEGDWATLSIADSEARDAAHQLVVNITNNIKTGHACDVNTAASVKDELENILQGGKDVSRQLRDLVAGPGRAYACQDLYDPNGIKPLPSQPPKARTDRLALDFGTQRLLLFSSQTVTFGRRSDWCDLSWRHPLSDRLRRDDPANIPYLKISKLQCTFEHRGEGIAVVDGVRDASGVVTHSSYGTFLDAERVTEESLLAAGGARAGRLSFSDSEATGALSLSLPGEICAKCTRADRLWCTNGKSPSLVLRRQDGVPETAVMLWSCFRLEEVAPSFAGVKIFREREGFAWRRGRRCGWLVPGETLETAVGTVRVDALPSPTELAQKRPQAENSTETCHH